MQLAAAARRTAPAPDAMSHGDVFTALRFATIASIQAHSIRHIARSRRAAMFSLAIFGGNKIDGGDLQPGERAVGLAVFGAMEMDFTRTPAPFVDVLLVALFGGVIIERPRRQRR